MHGGRGSVSSIARVMEMRIWPKTAYPNAALCAGFGTKRVGGSVYFVLSKMEEFNI